MNKSLAALTALSLAACAGGDRELPRWNEVLGVGNLSCATYLQRVRADPAAREAFTQWLMGYISALNVQAANINDVLGAGDLNAVDLTDPTDRAPADWLDGYCAGHPSMPFYAAASALVAKKTWEMRYRELRDQREEMHERLRGPKGRD